MSTSYEWLERLRSGTAYADLQVVFDEMAKDAQTTREPEAFAAAVDQAIQRLLRERARDEDELKEQEKEYEAFKEKQGGVLGWLKRKVPFTETRREEKEHQADVADQQAEILADNFFIARAQLLKEKVLPVAARRLGADADDWRRRLAAEDDVGRIRAYARGIAALQTEVRAARGFLKEIETDVEAFARARFSRDEDQRRQRADLQAARKEVAEREVDVGEKDGLREEGVDRLRALVTAELETNDPTFRAAGRRLDELEKTLGHATKAAKSLEGLKEGIATLGSTMTELEGLASKREALRGEERRLHDVAEAAQERETRALSLASGYESRVDAAKAAVAEATAALEAARRAHEAHVARSHQVELEPGADFASSSPQAAALVQAEKALEEARRGHQKAAEPHATARSTLEEATRLVRDAEKRIEAHRRDLDELATQEDALRRSLGEAQEKLRELRWEIRDGVGAFADAMRQIGSRSRLLDRRDPLVGPNRYLGPRDDDLPDRADEVEAWAHRLEDLLHAAQDDLAALEEEQKRSERERDAAWARRSQELLGDALASEVL